ncbi:MAG: hypothetical protein EOP45_08215, partial [Sphingobacteriaceae bacterium]
MLSNHLSIPCNNQSDINNHSDFKKSLEQSSGTSLDSTFSLLNLTGSIADTPRVGTKLGFLFSRKFYADYLRHPSKSVILLSPAIGLNFYDKVMIGGLVTNMFMPPAKFQFLAIPMYSTGAKRFAGI